MTEIMILSEFKKAIEEWGNNWGIETQIEVGELWINIHASRIGKSLGVVAEISNEDVCILNFSRLETMALEGAERQTLFKIVTKFASTMPADRKDEEKFYLRHRFMEKEVFSYLNFRLVDESYTLWTKNTVDYKSQFTMKEIESIKMLFDTDLKDFELIEVEENA